MKTVFPSLHGCAICPQLLLNLGVEPTISTHDSLASRLLKYLGGHLKSVKLFKTRDVAEKGWRRRSTPSLAAIIPNNLRVPLNVVVNGL